MKILYIFLCSLLFTLTSTYAQKKGMSAKEKFDRLDTDKDNVVTIPEMEAFYSTKKNKQGQLLNGELFFYAFDRNGDGKVLVDEMEDRPSLKKALKIYIDKYNKSPNEGSEVVSVPKNATVKKKRNKKGKEQASTMVTKDVEEMSLEEFKASYLKTKGIKVE